MRSTRPVLLGLAAGGALALSTALAFPASAAPSTPQCFQAQANVASQENTVQQAEAAKDKLAKDQAKVPVVPKDIADDQDAVSTYQQAVNSDQASLRTAKANLTAAIAIRDEVCATVSTPPPTTLPAPPPVGIPAQFGNCAQAARWGFHDIPSTSRYYWLILDRDRDGIACEINEGPAPVVAIPGPRGPAGPQGPAGPSGLAGTGSGPSTVVIVPPAPSGSNYGQIGQAPAGAASTGFGPNA
jgi:hypothetical protein